MSINSDSYRVVFEEYTKRHYIKDFEKDYKGAWLTTRKAIVSQLRNVDMLRDSGRFRNLPIHYSLDRKEWILKHEFAIAGLRELPHGSGRRLIAYVNDADHIVRVLLIYCKKHITLANETVWWEQIIKDEYARFLGNLLF